MPFGRCQRHKTSDVLGVGVEHKFCRRSAWLVEQITAFWLGHTIKIKGAVAAPVATAIATFQVIALSKHHVSLGGIVKIYAFNNVLFHASVALKCHLFPGVTWLAG